MATQVEIKTGAGQVAAFSRGRQSLEQSVWYSGWLLTFLATGEDTRGQFALMEQVARRATPRHGTSIIGKTKRSMWSRVR
jgi:hypothetical protein